MIVIELCMHRTQMHWLWCTKGQLRPRSLIKAYRQPGGIPVVEVTEGPDGMLRRRSCRHRVIMSGVQGDTPVLKGQSKCLGHSGYLGCSHCTMHGKQQGGMYFGGYLEATDGGTFTLPRTAHICAYVPCWFCTVRSSSCMRGKTTVGWVCQCVVRRGSKSGVVHHVAATCRLPP